MPLATAETKTRTFRFTQTILGVTQELFSVTLTCYWIDNGAASFIYNLKGKYTVTASGVTCSWDKNYSSSSDILHTLGLDFTYNFGFSNGFLIFSAMLNGSRTKVSFDFS